MFKGGKMAGENNGVRDKVILFHENGLVSIERVTGIEGETIETKNMMLPRGDCDSYANTAGGLVHVFNVCLPVVVEAEHVKNLRKSVALRNVLSFNNSDGSIDWMKWAPYFIIILMVLFHK